MSAIISAIIIHVSAIMSALKLGCTTNVDMLFLTNEFICLFYKNKFMLINGGHISNRSMVDIFITAVSNEPDSQSILLHFYTLVQS